jgi:trafficking kinesin-binding protein 2
MGKAKRLKLVFKNQTLVYLSSDSNLLGRLRKNQGLPVLIGSFGVPVCTSSPKMGILKED